MMEQSGGPLHAESDSTGVTDRTGVAATAVPQVATNTNPAATATIITFFGTFMIHPPSVDELAATLPPGVHGGWSR